MTAPGYRIRPMTRPDFAIALDWAANEGWNPGLNDLDCYWEADPQGFFMGWLGSEPVSSISLVKYGRTFAFLGFYIVTPEHRGKGYGLALWRHAMATADNRTVGLDGVVDQQENYKKSGFGLDCRNIRFQGRGRGLTSGSTAGIVPLAGLKASEVLAFDRPFFPEDRGRFLLKWTTQPGAVSLGIKEGRRLAGYGTVRECRSGYKIGPLFADTQVLAEKLFDALAGSVPEGADLFLDVPEPNTRALSLARSRHMTPCFETARMYAGSEPELPVDRMFGITSFEVG